MIALSWEFRSHHDRSRAVGPGGLAARGGTPAAAAVAAIRDAVAGLARLSAERAWSELKRILAARRTGRSGAALMAETSGLAAVLPEPWHSIVWSRLWWLVRPPTRCCALPSWAAIHLLLDLSEGPTVTFDDLAAQQRRRLYP
jgi:hypothetical protein